jgi:hypothetical protein
MTKLIKIIQLVHELAQVTDLVHDVFDFVTPYVPHLLKLLAGS